ncbi:hypothetical protein [Nocardiopsis lambiniae]|uniref:Uncharacterized protein n=1 Tax=Nocardiopsis lambiniae TaxID=3075539 RepID=A0ABU2MAW0_9ACTN|nr:hypothetical protein [Nocardiopsis sp. DSM 44743]MDT0329285.1 hypothetical protein [Nocardiopsis sp. DSM 44743]
MEDDPDLIAGALVRPYPDLVPRPRPAEREDSLASGEDEFAESADRIRTYLALRT